MAPPGLTPIPLFADLINSEHIVLENASSRMEVNPGSVVLNDLGSEKSTTLSYVTDSDVTRLDLSSNTMLNVSVTGLLLNGVIAPKVGSLVASTSSGLGWTTISDFLQLDSDRVQNTDGVTNMEITFYNNVTYTKAPAIILTPDSDGSGQIIPVSLDGYLSTTTGDVTTYTGFKVLFGSTKLKYFNYLVLPTNSNNIPAGVGGPSAPST